MQPDNQQPVYPTSVPEAPQKQSSKKWLIIIIIAVVLLGAIGAFLLLGKKKSGDKAADQPKNTGSTVVFGSSPNPVTYAGNKIYDACNFVPIDLLKTHIGDYSRAFDSMSTDKRTNEPLIIDHGYIDRTVPEALGKDNQVREPSIGIGETSVDRSVRAASFYNIGDSHCIYGQGKNFSSEFAAVYVVQPPARLDPTFAAYLDELKRTGRMAIESQGIQVYIEPVKEGDTTNTGIFRKGDTIVFMTTRKFELLQAASETIVAALAKDPAGPATITYPPFYSQLTDSCALLPAGDFQRLMGKPSSAVISEEWGVSEWGVNTARRECTRIEVERLKEGEVSSVRTELTESRTEGETKDRLAALKNDEYSKATPLKDLGDEAYTITREIGNINRSIVIRSGKVLITVESGGETKDANTDAFVSRTLPVAKVIFKNFKK